MSDLADGWFVIDRRARVGITRGRTAGGNYRVVWYSMPTGHHWAYPWQVSAATAGQAERAGAPIGEGRTREPQ